MNLQRMLELCDILHECDLLPLGMFRLWTKLNAIHQIKELYAASVGVRFYVCWPSGGYAQDVGYVESSS